MIIYILNNIMFKKSKNASLELSILSKERIDAVLLALADAAIEKK